MSRDVAIIKMPVSQKFLGRVIIKEVEVPFFFRIMTLEIVCDYLGIGLDDLFKDEVINGDRMPLAMLWCGYIAACKEMYQKPKYTEAEAEKWLEFMPKASREIYLKEISKLMGTLKNASGGDLEKKKS